MAKKKPKQLKPVLEGDWKRMLADMHDYEPTEWIRLDIPVLDLTIGKGIPRGRLIVVDGKPGAAKTAFALAACAAFQRAGGQAVFLDAEHKLEKEWAEKHQVDWEKLAYHRPANLDEWGRIIARVSQTAPSKTPVIVVTDSASAMPGAEELVNFLESAAGSGVGAEVGMRAREFSKTYRMTLTQLARKNVTMMVINQLRVKLNLFGPSSEEPPGGSASKYHSAVRLMFRAKERISSKKDKEVIVGQWFEMEVLKNNLAPPFRKCRVSLKYDTGFTQYSGFKDFLLRYGRISERTGWLVFGEKKFRSDQIATICAECPEILAPLAGVMETPDVKESKNAKDKGKDKEVEEASVE